MLKHPNLDQLNQLGLTGMAHAFADLDGMATPPVSAMPSGWPCCSIMKQPGAMTGAFFACIMQSCGTMLCLKTLITALRAGSIATCSRCCSRATGLPPTKTARLSGRPASARAG